MENILIPAAVAVIVFIVFLLLMPERISSDAERRKRTVLGQASQDARVGSMMDTQSSAPISLLKELPPGVGIFSRFPGVQSTVDLLLKAGLWQKRTTFLLASMLVFVVVCILLKRIFHLQGAAIVIALVASWWLPRKYLKRRIAKRNEQFLNLFPDTVDMIVRSVRSGHPLNTAMRMIAENMENPVKEEFKQVIDEVSYGRTLPEALSRLALRIDEQDLNFFVVVLSVQQETGGSLAEVLTNLSSIIRKRRQLRLKIRALTSEGRATSYVLGALPLVELGALYFVTPTYLDPMFDTSTGNMFLGAAIGLITLAMWIVRVMCNIDI
jgi:tight adherence protein B